MSLIVRLKMLVIQSWRWMGGHSTRSQLSQQKNLCMTSGLLNKTKLKKVRKVDRYQTENKFITKYCNGYHVHDGEIKLYIIRYEVGKCRCQSKCQGTSQHSESERLLLYFSRLWQDLTFSSAFPCATKSLKLIFCGFYLLIKVSVAREMIGDEIKDLLGIRFSAEILHYTFVMAYSAKKLLTCISYCISIHIACLVHRY